MENCNVLTKSILAVLFLSFSMLFVTSCDDGGEKPQTKTSMLTTGKWKLTAASFKASNGDVRDYMFTISECFRDNLHEFKTDSKYVVSEGTNPCANGDQSVGDKGEWAFSENDTRLQFSFPYYGSRPYEVNTLTNSNMVLVFSEADGSTLTFTFSKQ